MTTNPTPAPVADAKHTSGPWEIVPQPTYELIYGPNSVLVGSAYGGTRTWGISLKERRANARLIAAAPEMLEALRWAVGMAEEAIIVRETGDDPEDTPEIIAMHRQELARAQAVLAKAEGR